MPGVGGIEGDMVGAIEGCCLQRVNHEKRTITVHEDTYVGLLVGLHKGTRGWRLHHLVMYLPRDFVVGDLDGASDGASVGAGVASVGVGVGTTVGVAVGDAVGATVAIVGAFVGILLGANVTSYFCQAPVSTFEVDMPSCWTFEGGCTIFTLIDGGCARLVRRARSTSMTAR